LSLKHHGLAPFIIHMQLAIHLSSNPHAAWCPKSFQERSGSQCISECQDCGFEFGSGTAEATDAGSADCIREDGPCVGAERSPGNSESRGDAQLLSVCACHCLFLLCCSCVHPFSLFSILCLHLGGACSPLHVCCAPDETL